MTIKPDLTNFVIRKLNVHSAGFNVIQPNQFYFFRRRA